MGSSPPIELISKSFFTSVEVENIAPKFYDKFLQKLGKIQIGKGLKCIERKLKSFLLILNLKKKLRSKAEERNMALIPDLRKREMFQGTAIEG